MSGLNAQARTAICSAEPGWNQPQGTQRAQRQKTDILFVTFAFFVVNVDFICK